MPPVSGRLELTQKMSLDFRIEVRVRHGEFDAKRAVEGGSVVEQNRLEPVKAP